MLHASSDSILDWQIQNIMSICSSCENWDIFNIWLCFHHSWGCKLAWSCFQYKSNRRSDLKSTNFSWRKVWPCCPLVQITSWLQCDHVARIGYRLLRSRRSWCVKHMLFLSSSYYLTSQPDSLWRHLERTNECISFIDKQLNYTDHRHHSDSI